MGAITPPLPVLGLLAVTSRYDEAFQWARHRLEAEVGPLQLVSQPFVFDQTDYYQASMGTNLKKQFLVPSPLIDPEILGLWKVETNRWEELFRDEFQLQHPDCESRPLNLDPGYLSQDKLVLASTKNHAHRIYLTCGIYAEITLQFRAKSWQPCPWTYPDYRQPEFHAFFDEARHYLREQLKGVEPPDGA